MAHASLSIPLWDSKNTEERTIVSLCPKHEILLNSKRVQLTKRVNLAPLWPYLRQYDIVTKDDRGRIQLGSICEDQVDKLIDHLESNPCWRLHAFLKACRDTKQEHVIHLLGLDPETYSDGGPSPDLPESSASETTTTAPTEFQMKAGLRMHAASYQRRLLRGNLFGFKHKTSYDTFPITECHIEQDLEIKRGGRIAAKDTFKGLGNGRKPQTILLSGPPGAGKTTFLEAIAHQWSEEHENFVNNQNHSPKPNHAIVVYAPAMDMKGDISSSIESNICCIDKDDRKYITQHLRRDVSSAILFDALDEIRDDELLSDLEHFIKENLKIGGPQILVSARTGLSRLKKDIFERSLQLEGFTLEQGLQYIELFFESKLDQIYTETEDTKRMNTIQPNEILSYVRKNKERMKVILCNPLRVHILCGLTAQRVLKLDGDNISKPLYLLKCLEEYFIRRETKGNQVPEHERHNFYRMCLHGLLTNIRHFTEKDFDKFKISPDSPYMAFFKPLRKPDESANEVAHYSFIHETFFEFFAVRCIEVLPDDQKKAVILSVCSEDVLQNVRVMICQMFSQYETKETSKLVIGMIKTMLLYNQKFDGVGDILAIREDIEMNVPKAADLLLHQSSFQTEGFSSKVTYVWDQIEKQFAELNDELKKFWADVLFSDDMEDVYACLSEFHMGPRINIINNAIYRLLPLERFSEHQATYVYPTGKLRWSKVNHQKNEIAVIGFCLSDCLDTLLEHHTKHLYHPNSIRMETNVIKSVLLEVKHCDHCRPALFDSKALLSSVPKEQLRAVFMVYEGIESIVINFGYGSHYLLNNLLTLVNQVPDIVIEGGNITLEDFHRWWCETGKKYQGRITLKHVKVVLPDRVQQRKKAAQQEQEAGSGDLSDGPLECYAAYAEDKLTLSLTNSPCRGLLDYMVTLGDRVPDIVIQYGEISLEDFHRWWCESGQKYQGRIALAKVEVVLPDRVHHRNKPAHQEQEAVSGDLSDGHSKCVADYAEDELTLKLLNRPCIGLLDYLVTQGDRVPDIVIKRGKISLEDFRRWWCGAGQKYQGRIKLSDVEVVLPYTVHHRNKLALQEQGAVSGDLSNGHSACQADYAEDRITLKLWHSPCIGLLDYLETLGDMGPDIVIKGGRDSWEDFCRWCGEAGHKYQGRIKLSDVEVVLPYTVHHRNKLALQEQGAVSGDLSNGHSSCVADYADDEITLSLLGSPFICLLDYLETLGGRGPDLVIRWGHISWEDFHRWWCEAGHKYKGRITLYGVKVVFPDRVYHRNKLALQELEAVSGDLPDRHSACVAFYAKDKLTLRLGYSPCIGLLDYLVILGDKVPDIDIRWGRISLEDFYRWWCESGQEYQGRISLEYVEVVLPDRVHHRNKQVQREQGAVSGDLSYGDPVCYADYADDKLTLNLWDTPCIGLLDYLVTLGDKGPGIGITNGRISWEAFYRWWCESGHKYQGRIKLEHLKVVLPDRVHHRNKLAQQEQEAVSGDLSDGHSVYYAENKLTLSLRGSQCIVSLLDYLVTLGDQVPDIVIRWGRISLEDFYRWWCESGHKYQGRITLKEVEVVLPHSVLQEAGSLHRFGLICYALYDEDKLTLRLFSSPCICLLDYLETLGGRGPDIVIEGGRISWEDFYRWWCDSGHKYQGRIALEGVKVVLPDRVHHRNELAQQEQVPGVLFDGNSAYRADYAEDKVIFRLRSSPCIGLLDYLVTLGGRGPNIVIKDGAISLEYFHRWWCESGHKYQGRITLQELKVVLPIEDECRKQLIQRVREAVSEELAEKMGSCDGLHEDPIHLSDKLEITGLEWRSPQNL